MYSTIVSCNIIVSQTSSIFLLIFPSPHMRRKMRLACETRVVTCKCIQLEVNDIRIQLMYVCWVGQSEEVTCAPKPMAALCLQQQLTNLNRFCCDPHNFSILGIDPTYCLGEFSVTPTVYHHLILEHHKSNFSLDQCWFTTGRSSATTTSSCLL